MGDKIYPGVIFRSVHESVTQAQILETFKSKIRKHELGVNGWNFTSFRTPPGKTTRFLLVTGINLPLREIRERFALTKFNERSLIHVFGPDFGLERDIYGSLVNQGSSTQKVMEEAYGSLPPINFFTEDFNKELGDIPNWGYIVYWNSVDNRIKCMNLKKAGKIISYTKDAHPSGKGQFKDNPTCDCYAIEFKYKLEGMQLVCFHNNGRFLHSDELKVKFITRAEEPRLSDAKPYMYISSSEKDWIPCEDYVRNLKFVPLSAVSENIIDMEKLKQMTPMCQDCKELIEIIGFDVDLAWLAGRCKCCLKGSKYRHGDEDFVRLYIPSGNRKYYSRYGPEDILCRQPAVRLLPDMMPVFETVEDCRLRAFSAFQEECKLAKQLLAEEKAKTLAINQIEFIEHMEKRKIKKRKVRDIFTLTVTVQKTKVWSEEGLAKMHDVIITPIGEVRPEDWMTIGVPQLPQNLHGVVYNIQNDISNDSSALVTLQVFLPDGDQIRFLKAFEMTPKPPVTVKNGVRQSFADWRRLFNNYHQKLLHISGYISKAVVVGTTVWTRHLEPFNVWVLKIPFSTTPLWTSLRNLMQQNTKPYLGIDISTDYYMKNGQMELLEETGKVLDIVIDDEYTGSVEFALVLPSEYDMSDRDACFQLTMMAWAVHFRNDYTAEVTNALPAGYREMDDEQDASDDDSEDDSDGSENEYEEDRSSRAPTEGDGSKLEIEACRKVGFELEIVQVHPKIYTQAHRPEEHHQGNPEDYLSDWLSSMFLNGQWDEAWYHDPADAENVRPSMVQQIVSNWRPSVIRYPRQGEYLLRPFMKPYPSQLQLRTASSLKIYDDKLVETLLNQLNQSQRTAVEKMLNDPHTYVHGPPGTGKSFTLTSAAILHSILKAGLTSVVSPSNYAADVVYTQILTMIRQFNLDITVTRMAAHSREEKYNRQRDAVNEDISQNWLHTKVEMKIRENGSLTNLMEAGKRNKGAHMQRDQKRVLHDGKVSAAVEVLKETHILVCTVPCAGDNRLSTLLTSYRAKHGQLNAMLCDEASLVHLPAFVGLMLHDPRSFCVIGDFCQLSPTISSEVARISGLGVSLMEAMILTPFVKTNDVVTMLNVQHRMCLSLAAVISDFMYSGRLTSSPSVHLREKEYGNIRAALELPGMENCNIGCFTYDISAEKNIKDSPSYYNQTELDIIKALLLHLYAKHYSMKKISIISMYELQVSKLKEMVVEMGDPFMNVDVGTVDSNQGKENNMIILSTVRSNKQKLVGFLSDKRRMNVGLSRAKDFLLIVGDIRTLRGSKLKEMELLFNLLCMQHVNVAQYGINDDNAAEVTEVIKLSDYLVSLGL